jgi:uncharacterized protein YukE
MVGEPEAIRAVARRLRQEAEQVRVTAGRIGATGDVPWRSGAADAFRERVAQRAAGSRRAAQLLHDAAEAVDQHARAVEAVRAGLAGVADGALSLVTGRS